MTLKQLQDLVRKKIIESFDKKLQEKRILESSNDVEAMSESSLRHFVRSQLRESQIRSSFNEEK